jgi:hypothetical protein
MGDVGTALAGNSVDCACGETLLEDHGSHNCMASLNARLARLEAIAEAPVPLSTAPSGSPEMDEDVKAAQMDAARARPDEIPTVPVSARTITVAEVRRSTGKGGAP